MAKKPIIKITEAESAYRTKNYHDFRIITQRQLTCTSCGNEVSTIHGSVFSHPILEVLQCNTCLKKYQTTDFKTKKGKCILCCNYSSYSCGNKNCPYEYCKKCIKRNVNSCIQEAEKDDWECFVCDPKPFWELRGICATVMSSLNKTKQLRRASREGSQDSISERIKHLKTTCPTQKKELRKSKKTLKTLYALCDDSDEEITDHHSHPLHKRGLNNIKESRLSSDSSDDFKFTRKKMTSRQRAAKKVTRSPSSSSNNSSCFEKGNYRTKSRAKMLDKGRRKLYTLEEKELLFSPTEISSDEDKKKEQKHATLRFKHNFSILFEDMKTLISQFSAEIEKCEKQCLEKDVIREEDALETTKRVEKILKKIEVDITEKCKKVDKTYQSWNKNFKTCFKTKNGIRKPRRRSTSTSDEQVQNISISDEQVRSTSTSEEQMGGDKEMGEVPVDVQKEKSVEVENNENGVVSECDSEIFSGDESRKKSSDSVSESKKESSKKPSRRKSRENSAERSTRKNSRSSEEGKSSLKEGDSKSMEGRDSEEIPVVKAKDIRKVHLKSLEKRKSNMSSEESSDDRLVINQNGVSSRNSSPGKVVAEKERSVDKLLEKEDEYPEKDKSPEKDKLPDKDKSPEKDASPEKDESIEKDEPSEKDESPDKDVVKESRRSEFEDVEARTNMLLSDIEERLSTPKSCDGSIESCSTVCREGSRPDDSPSRSSPLEIEDLQAKEIILKSSSDSESRKGVSEVEELEEDKEKHSSKKGATEKESVETLVDAEKDKSSEKLGKELEKSSDSLEMERENEKEMEKESGKEKEESIKQKEKGVKEREKGIIEKEKSINENEGEKEVENEKENEESEQGEEENEKDKEKNKRIKETEKEALKEKVDEGKNKESKKADKEREELSPLESSPEASKEASDKQSSQEASAEGSENFLDKSESDDGIEDSVFNSPDEKNSDERAKKDLLKSSTDMSSAEEVKASEDDKKAKQALMNSSSGEESPDLFTSFEMKPSKRKRNESDDENSESCRSRRKRKIKLSKNPYYRADRKLRMSCCVVLKRLSRQTLRKHAKALQRSKQYLEQEKLKRYPDFKMKKR